jgi:hypothetical protein
VGVDPFASYRSIEAHLSLNSKLKKINKKDYFLLKLDKKEPYCMGSNGFMFRKDLINEVGPYAQDVEFIARISKLSKKNKFAVVNNAKVWHKNIDSLISFIKKRIKWTKNYSKIYVNEKKDFEWITNKKKFFIYVLKNLLIFPNLFISLKKYIETKDVAWFLHPFLMFFSTSLNIYFTIFSKKMIMQLFK